MNPDMLTARENVLNDYIKLFIDFSSDSCIPLGHLNQNFFLD